MASENEPKQETSEKGSAGAGTPDSADTPPWTDGLKQLYRSVVDEPLPGSFKDLLDQFDEIGDDGASCDPADPA